MVNERFLGRIDLLPVNRNKGSKPGALLRFGNVESPRVWLSTVQEIPVIAPVA